MTAERAFSNGKYLLGACQELFALLPDASVDAVITDPPYGMGKGDWDLWNAEIAMWLVAQCLRILKPTGSLYLFGRNETIASMWGVFAPLNPRWLTWYYRNSSNINQNTWGWNSQVIVYGHCGQPVYNLDEARVPYAQTTNTKRVQHDDTTSRFGISKNGKSDKHYNAQGRKPMDVLEWPAVTAGVAEAEGRWHPTQKPLGLLETLVKVSTPQGGLVVDPFAGGATTLLAASNTGRRFWGCEKEERFWAAGCERLQKEARG